MALNHEKLIEEIGKLTALDLADLVKGLETAFGVSAAMAAPQAAAAAPAAEKAEEKSEYKVILTDVGSEKIKVIKALRVVLPTLGLTEAKAKTEELPSVVAEAAPREEAMKMKKELEAAGAKVELK